MFSILCILETVLIVETVGKQLIYICVCVCVYKKVYFFEMKKPRKKKAKKWKTKDSWIDENSYESAYVVLFCDCVHLWWWYDKFRWSTDVDVVVGGRESHWEQLVASCSTIYDVLACPNRPVSSACRPMQQPRPLQPLLLPLPLRPNWTTRIHRHCPWDWDSQQSRCCSDYWVLPLATTMTTMSYLCCCCCSWTEQLTLVPNNSHSSYTSTACWLHQDRPSMIRLTDRLVLPLPRRLISFVLEGFSIVALRLLEFVAGPFKSKLVRILNHSLSCLFF